jgi:multicomponent Na+:H+ antiporter subunit B
MHDDPVIRVVSKVLIPSIMLYALYVQFHGDYGPGGGFQAGVIFAVGFILNAIVFGVNRGRHVWPSSLNLQCIALGLLIYGGTGVASLFLDGNYLDYNVLSGDPVAGQHLGILLVELGVGLTVSSVMVALFFAFAMRGEHVRLLAHDGTEGKEKAKTKPKAKPARKPAAKGAKS